MRSAKRHSGSFTAGRVESGVGGGPQSATGRPVPTLRGAALVAMPGRGLEIASSSSLIGRVRRTNRDLIVGLAIIERNVVRRGRGDNGPPDDCRFVAGEDVAAFLGARWSASSNAMW